MMARAAELHRAQFVCARITWLTMGSRYLFLATFVLFLGLLLSWDFAAAQITGPVYVSPPSMFEGQKVGTIELIANPKVNVDSYRHLIQQPENSPYSVSKLQASLNALRRTSRFNKIELEVRHVSSLT